MSCSVVWLCSFALVLLIGFVQHLPVPLQMFSLCSPPPPSRSICLPLFALSASLSAVLRCENFLVSQRFPGIFVGPFPRGVLPPARGCLFSSFFILLSFLL